MQIQKINSSQNNPNFNGLLKVSKDVVLISEEILSGVHYGNDILEFSTGKYKGHFMTYRNPFDGSKMAVKLKSVNDELLAKIASARSTISDTVEDISEFVERIIKVHEKVDV